jgi:methionyl-tRNA formyltransferase
MRIIFMGTPDFAVSPLKRLLSSDHRLVAVYTSPDKTAGRGQELSVSPVKRVALDHSLDIRQVRSLKDDAAVASLAQLQPDAIVVASYGLILPHRVLSIPPFGCINLHPSRLPRHRGPTPIPSAIFAGDEETGVSIMLMDEGIDTGPILSQQKVPIAPDDTTASLTDKLSHLSAQLLMETLPGWFGGEIKPQPQLEADATYTKMLDKADGEIDWRMPAVDIARRVRAFHPWPGCYTRWRGKTLKVIAATPLAGKRGTPGQTMATEGGAGIQTGDGILVLRQVQIEGKRQMDIAEFLRGQRDFIGSTLPS